MQRIHKTILIGCLALAGLGRTTARAYDLPAGLNLGFTSFMDGAPPAGPGFYFTEYLNYYHTERFNDQNSHQSFPSKLDVYASLSQVIFQSDRNIFFGGKWGLDLILPVVGFDLDSHALNANSAGIGDMYVGPFLQWDPIMGKNGPIFMHRFELQIITPTGRYSDRYALNPGSNLLSLNPYWAGTVFLTPKWTADWRLHYLWNDENDDFAPGGVTMQPGQAVHLNFSSAYEVLEKTLRVGINGYYLKQFTDMKINGQTMLGNREQVLGIGPGVVWHISKHDHLFLNAYWELAAENRTEGQRVNLRYVHHF